MEQIKLPGGDNLRRDDQAVIIKFSAPRRLLSTSYLNGGYRDDITAVFNFSEVFGVTDEHCEMRAPTNEGHLRLIAEELGLNPNETAGLSTAAKMKYAIVKSERYDDFSVTAIVTAGIDVSGSRAGDPSGWHETAGVPVPAKPGTINIILVLDADLAPGALVRALATCTEAKTAALQELLSPSCFSRGLATGSGTDGTIIVSNPGSPVFLTNAGHHSKLGEYIGRVVKETVIEALVAENGFKSFTRGNLFKRVSRFGITSDNLKTQFMQSNPTDKDLELKFEEGLRILSADDNLVAQATLYAHLLDLLQWKLIDPPEALQQADYLLAGIVSDRGLIAEKIPSQKSHEAKSLISGLSDQLACLLIRVVAEKLD